MYVTVVGCDKTNKNGWWSLGPRVCCFGWGDDGRCAFDVNEAVQIQQEEESGEGSDSAVRRAASRAGARRRRKMAKDDGPAGESTDARMRKLVTDPHVVTSLMGRAVQGEVCEVACGAKHTLICTTRGKAFSFGSNEFSQLGGGKACETKGDAHSRPSADHCRRWWLHFSCICGRFQLICAFERARSIVGAATSWAARIATAPKGKRRKRRQK